MLHEPAEHISPPSSRQNVAAIATSRGRLPAICAIVLAFLGTQHHNIMMLLLAVGFSDAAMGFMTVAPLIRTVMLGMSLVMVAVITWQMRVPGRTRSMRILGLISIVATVSLSAWSIAQFGW